MDLEDPAPIETPEKGETHETVPHLNSQQIALVTERLRSGDRLPAHLFPFIFETPKEYELSYSGKSRRADVLAETIAVPLQPVKRFGARTDQAWSNMLILGDNIQVLKTLLEWTEGGRLENSDGTVGPRLIYLDPPFATGEAWETRAGRVAYVDKVKGAEFIEWLRQRLILMTELLAEDGSIIVHLDQRYAHYIKVVLDELLPGNFRNEIVVPRGIKGVQSQFERIDALAQGHYSLLLYSRRAAVRYPKLFDEGKKPSRWDTFWLGTSRRTMRYDLFGTTPESGQWRWSEEKSLTAIANYERYLREAPEMQIEEYADLVESQAGKRPDFLRKGPAGQPQWYRYAKKRRLASDVWDVQTKGSITGFPTEKHEDLLERIISWLTREGDLVLDAFVGSGTTVAVAERLDRRWIGIDSTKYAIYVNLSRLLRQRMRGDSSGLPFTLNMAGLYDYQALRALPWSDYKSFVLDLFQCRPTPETIGGVSFDGYLGDNLVLVHNFKEHPEAKIGADFVTDLRRLCGDRLGKRCFVIAPALLVEPYEDYLDVDGTRFFFLRIPYSIIAELHRKSFTALRQPTSEETANATIESVGFDFIQPPRVECRYQQDGGILKVTISEFESEAYSAAPSEANIRDLAMVMVDYDFDGEVFDLDAVHYAQDLAAAQWTIGIPSAEVGKQLMLVYLDVYGNEHRETKKISDFAGASPLLGRTRTTTGRQTPKSRTARSAPRRATRKTRKTKR